MAEALLLAEDLPPYSKGDVIEIRGDGAKYGSAECLPRFLIVKIEGREADLKYLQCGKFYLSTEGGIERKTTIYERQYNFSIDSKLTAKDLDDISKSETLLIKPFVLADITDKDA